MKLYSYFRSSAAFRVRIALALKGLAYDYEAVHLVKREQVGPYASMVHAQLVPALDLRDSADAASSPPEDGTSLLTQSLAIIEYLDEVHPAPPLLPADPLGRARVRSIAHDIACDIHPIDNLRVLRYLTGEMGVSEDDKDRWYRHWVDTGLSIVEKRLAGSAATGAFCHGDTPGLADCTLVPQVFNAQRMACRLDSIPTVMRVFERCMAEPAFQSAQPSACPDAA